MSMHVLQTAIQAKILLTLAAILALLLGVVGYVSYQQHRADAGYKQVKQQHQKPIHGVGKSLQDAHY